MSNRIDPVIAYHLDRMQSPKLRAITEHCLFALVALFADREDRINRALTEVEDGKLTLSHGITINLDANKLINKLSFSLKDSDEVSETIPDPDQPDLPNFTMEVVE